MPQNKWLIRGVVLVSLLVALIMRVVPLPRELPSYNPDWVLLFLIYWSMAVPERVGVGYAWCFGLLCDALTARMLGQHALAYVVVVFICLKWHRRLRLAPIYQQMFSVLLLLLLDQLLIFWTKPVKTASTNGLSFWLPSFSGALIWPAVLLTLRYLRRRHQIA